jgi:DNA processing protein
MSTSIDLVALTLLPLWRRRVIAEELRAGHPPAEILQTPRTGSAQIGVDCLRTRAAAALDSARRKGIDAVGWDEPAYPPALAAIVDPPPVLWLRGSRQTFDRPAVAIVGSRDGSSYALQVAMRLASDLAACGVVVVSGLARGVDSVAHRGALSMNGVTVAVLGCGADRVYPHEHGDLAEQISVDGALVSELVPGTPPHPRFFPMRNRIISGLSRAVVVVEAGEKSGSLITARCALDQGRDVLAVPGNVLSGRNRGGHALLKDGAAMVESVDDVLRELGLSSLPHTALTAISTEGVGPSVPGAASKAMDGVSRTDPILACLIPGEPSDLDAISALSGLPPSRLLTRLLELELQGFVGRAGGGRFVRLDRSC